MPILAENPVHHSRIKHIDIRYHYIRDLVRDGVFNINYIKTDDNCADALTKPLLSHKFNTLTNVFMSTYDMFAGKAGKTGMTT